MISEGHCSYRGMSGLTYLDHQEAHQAPIEEKTEKLCDIPHEQHTLTRYAFRVVSPLDHL